MLRFSTSLAASVSCLIFGCTSTGLFAQSTTFFDNSIAQRYDANLRPLLRDIDSLESDASQRSMSVSQAQWVVNRQSSLQQASNDVFYSAQRAIDNAAAKGRTAISQFNTDNKQRTFESAIMGTVADGLANVAKYPTRSAFEENKLAMAAQWDRTYGAQLQPYQDSISVRKQQVVTDAQQKYGVNVDDLFRARIGEVNPYTDEQFIRYYGDDGQLMYLRWSDDADGYRRYRAASNVFFKRAQDTQELLQRQAESLSRFEKNVQSKRNEVNNKLANLGNSARNALQNAAQRERQRIAQEQQRRRDYQRRQEEAFMWNMYGQVIQQSNQTWQGLGLGGGAAMGTGIGGGYGYSGPSQQLIMVDPGPK